MKSLIQNCTKKVNFLQRILNKGNIRSIKKFAWDTMLQHKSETSEIALIYFFDYYFLSVPTIRFYYWYSKKMLIYIIIVGDEIISSWFCSWDKIYYSQF